MPPATSYETVLRQAPILREASQARFEEVCRRAVRKSASPGSFILTQGDTSTDVYFVIEGRVRIHLYSLSGRDVSFHEIGPGGMFGEFAAIDRQPRSASVEAIDDVTVAKLGAEDFWQLLLSEREALRTMLLALTTEIRNLTERVFEFSTLAVNNRVQAELLRLARRSQGQDGSARISPAPTHADIASRISTHREAVSRELSRLAQLGVIAREGHSLIVPDLERLEEIVRRASDG